MGPLSRNPAALQLGYLQTLLELGGEKSTIVFPLPMDLIKPFLGSGAPPDSAPAAPELNISAHADALRRLLKGPDLSSAGNHWAGVGEAHPVLIEPAATTGRADPGCRLDPTSRVGSRPLVFDMNDRPLPPTFGAPLPLGVECTHGYKVVKYLPKIEWIEDCRTVGDGMGGHREDSSL